METCEKSRGGTRCKPANPRQTSAARAMAPPAASLACACCGKEPEAGRKFASCELCVTRNLPTTRYCSEACQAKHWEEGGHKAWHAEEKNWRKERKESGAQQEERTRIVLLLVRLV